MRLEETMGNSRIGSAESANQIDGKPNLVKDKGPIKDRGCTDVLCFLLLIAFLAGWVVVGIYAFQNGNPLKLVYPSDSSGLICGSDTGLEEKPYLLFFDLTKCIKPGSVALGCPTRQVRNLGHGGIMKEDKWE